MYMVADQLKCYDSRMDDPDRPNSVIYLATAKGEPAEVAACAQPGGFSNLNWEVWVLFGVFTFFNRIQGPCKHVHMHIHRCSRCRFALCFFLSPLCSSSFVRRSTHHVHLFFTASLVDLHAFCQFLCVLCPILPSFLSPPLLFVFLLSVEGEQFCFTLTCQRVTTILAAKTDEERLQWVKHLMPKEKVKRLP